MDQHCIRSRSRSGSDWHIQREALGESHEHFSGCIGALLKRVLSSRPKTFEKIEEYLADAHLHPMGGHCSAAVSQYQVSTEVDSALLYQWRCLYIGILFIRQTVT